MLYAFSENYVLPLSHDEVVHGKGSLVNKMPGDDWRRLANLRLLFTYQFTHPGKKLIFMGSEFGQWHEWAHDGALEWDLASHDRHKGVQLLVRDLNRLYRTIPAMHVFDFDGRGFEWVDFKDWEHSVISYLRKGEEPEDVLLIACNFTPVPRPRYLVGVPLPGFWKEILNSDASVYGGSNVGNSGGVATKNAPCFGRKQSLQLMLPPLGAVVLQYEKPKSEKDPESNAGNNAVAGTGQKEPQP